MDTPRVSQMWKILQETNKLPQSQVLAGAEEELQELMRQIDIMVQGRKAEWEREKQALLARLNIKEKEQLIQSSTLEEKHKEIGHLRAQLELVEQSQRNATAEYEKQLSGLREQIANMKKEFEKLHRRYSKKAKQAEAVQQRTSTDSLERAEELKRLNSKLEEFRKRAKDWEKKRRGYEDQIELLQKQMLMLQDGPRQPKASGSDPSVSEMIHSNEMLSAEKQQLQTSLTQTEKQVTKLQKELEQLRSENEMTQQIITDQRKLINKLEETLKQNNTPTRRTDNTDAEYQRQIRDLNKQISDLYREKEMLAVELRNMADERKDVELKKMQEYTKELSKLKAGQQTIEEAHEGEIRGLKNELQSVTRELHEKTRKLAELQEKLSATEKKAKEYVQLLDRTQAQLHVALAQRDALRLENQNLRHIALTREGLDINKTEAEYQLRELQKAYSAAVSSLESQNKKLMSEVVTLKTRLSASEGDNLERSQHVLNESHRSLMDLQDTEQKKIIELERKYKKEMQTIQEKLNITVQQYENQIESLRMEMSTLQDELDLQNQSIKHFPGDQRVLAKFVNGASNLIHASSHLNNNTSHIQENTSNSDHQSQSNSARSTRADFSEEIDEDFLLNDSVEAAKARFLDEQRERTQQLEQQLDSHIQYLKQCTNETIRKNSVKSH